MAMAAAGSDQQQGAGFAACDDVVNAAAYLFVPLDALDKRRERYKVRCLELDLKGTIVLSPEGINLFLAGSEGNVATFLDELRHEPEFSGLEAKLSRSHAQPFGRLRVKLKRKIIPFAIEGIAPGKETSSKLLAGELRSWLDEGRPVTLLDVRNDYEIEHGTFAGARTLGLGHFRDFPEAARALEDDLKHQPVVMFCTGGIRCEKAGPYLEQQGFEQVYQLDGGILKYFEECGHDHYEGDCFVFDERIAVDPQLRPVADV